ncbi:MAG: biotin/lipoyl-binding protein, partial [Bacteroidaceae bacterium]
METKFKVVLFFMLISLSSCRKGDNSNNETAVSVKVQTVGIATDNNSQFYSGTVKEENGVALSFINGGTIEQMAVDEGQYVKKGQLIAKSNTSQAYYQWQAAHTQTLQARDYYNRLMQLKATNSIPAVQLVEAQSKLREAKSQEA